MQKFRDTLGLVLMKQEKYEEAITEFEKVLPAAGSKKPVHRNLAICYQKLGRLEMAKSHADKSK
jgi:Tfp pilus assembly protein PilF